MDVIFNFIFEVVFFRIGRWIIKVLTFNRVEITLNGKLQPLASLVGFLGVMGVTLTAVFFVRN